MITSKDKDKLMNGNVNTTERRETKKIPKRITDKYLHNSGLAYLQRFPSSTMNFERVMMRKIKKSCNYHKEQDLDICKDLLKRSVENFIRMGLLNDDAYLKGMITSLRRKGLSKQAILAKLQMKGFSNTTARENIQSYDDNSDNQTYDHDFMAAVLYMRRKKLGPFRTKIIFEEQKELAALARAGFGYDVADKALKLPPSEAEAILSEARI
jgi:regulatory protein